MTFPAGRSRLDNGVRTLDDDDLDAAWRLLASDPIAHVLVASRVDLLGLESWRLGCPILGDFRDGELVAMCHCGANLVPVCADEQSQRAFVAASTGIRRCSSIAGPAAEALGLWQLASERFGRAWSTPREVRRSQPLMVIEGEPAVAGDHRVEQITGLHTEAYFEAAVQMYCEEVGVSPIQGGDRSHYLRHVSRLINTGRAFGIVENGRVIFKADIGAAAQGVGQVQGVWLDPALRGQGMSAPAMASVVELAQPRNPTLSLYVNDFNTAARATYRRVGFTEIGEFATVLY